MEIPATWTIDPDADRERVEDVLERLGENLGIGKPEIKNDYAMLPADYPKVAKALDEIEPGWKEEGLLIPPEP